MRRIDQLFTLAERYVGAYERYVDETVRRYRAMEVEAKRGAENSERMTKSMESKVYSDAELGPAIESLTEKLAGLAAHLAKFDTGTMLDGLRALLPNGAATPEVK